MKTFLALMFALLVVVPVTAEAAQDNWRQDNWRQGLSLQKAERGGVLRAEFRDAGAAQLIQVQARGQRQAGPQRQARQQRQARPQRQARQQQRQAQPQRQARQQRAVPPQNRNQVNGNRANRGAGQRPNRAAPNRQGQNRFAQNRQGRNRAAQNLRNNRQGAGRFGGNRNNGFNGRRGGGRQYYYSGNYRPSIRVRPYSYPHSYPRGHYYTTWQIGAYLPSLFFGAQYYYDDYYQLGLAPPPRGFRWVRYGTDVLLVNLYSGEVVDIVYSAFYW
jgi:Ni/Co efflux regulator RcnB